jgi:[ribosomal protein S5]-alanine N-acetyltransferase
MSSAIRSRRLDLIPMTPAFLRWSLAGDRARAEHELRLALPADWPADAGPVLRVRLDQLESDPSLQPWLLRAIGLRSTGRLIGYIGFHDAPGAEGLRAWAPGGAEFGFTVFAPYRRHGYAREASLALMDWARAVHDVTAFVLSISPGNRPSQALAAGLGFVRVGSQEDDVDGPEDVLVLNG